MKIAFFQFSNEKIIQRGRLFPKAFLLADFFTDVANKIFGVYVRRASSTTTKKCMKIIPVTFFVHILSFTTRRKQLFLRFKVIKITEINLPTLNILF